MSQKAGNRAFDPLIFWVSSGIAVAFGLWSLLFPENMNTVINGAFGRTIRFWGWLYLLTAFALVLACFALMGNRCGKMKPGLPEDKPEFSNFSWFAMLFGSAIAAGIVFWGPAEIVPIYSGELKALQTASIVGAFPFIFVMFLLLVSVIKELLAEYRQSDRQGSRH